LVALLGNLPTVAAPAGLAGLIASAAAANTASEAATTLAVGAVRDWWLVQVRRLMP
jgi:tetrahydromethanopterin S-methyltransferase subunit D